MGHHRHIEVQPALRALHPFAKLLGVHYSVTRVIVWRCRMPEGYADEPMMKYKYDFAPNMLAVLTCNL